MVCAGNLADAVPNDKGKLAEKLSLSICYAPNLSYLYAMLDPGIISDKIGALDRLAEKKVILIDEVEPLFHRDLLKFLVGQTLTMRNGQVVIDNHTYRKWLDKIRRRGFDEEIELSPA
jgi:hypothetical protein